SWSSASKRDSRLARSKRSLSQSRRHSAAASVGNLRKGPQTKSNKRQLRPPYQTRLPKASDTESEPTASDREDALVPCPLSERMNGTKSMITRTALTTKLAKCRLQ